MEIFLGILPSGATLPIRQTLADASQTAILGGGTVPTIEFYEEEPTTGFKSLELAAGGTQYTFQPGAISQATDNMTSVLGQNGTVDFGCWEYIVTSTGFTAGRRYKAVIRHVDLPGGALTLGFQYGGGSGDSVVQTGDAYGRLGAPVGASISADIAANATALGVVKGLLAQNVGFRNTTYTGSNLTAYDMCLYDSAAHAATNDGATGLLHKFSFALTYDGSNNLTGWSSQQVS